MTTLHGESAYSLFLFHRKSKKKLTADFYVNFHVLCDCFLQIYPGISRFGYGDPLDVLFGGSSSNEEPLQPDESENLGKVQSRSQKRARRRHRLRHGRQDSLLMGGS